MSGLRATILAGGFLVVSTALAGQAVTGIVCEDETAQPVQGVAVMLVGPGDAIAAGVLTDSAGRFLITAPRAGRYALRSDRIGYHPVTTPMIDLTPPDTLHVELRISVEAVLLAPLTITSRRGPANVDRRLASWGYYERRAEYSTLGSGTAHFLDIEYIKKRAPMRVTDLFRDLHGVRLSYAGGVNALVWTTRGCSLDVYLDGMFVGASAAMDDWVTVSDLAAVEVYASFPYPARYAPRPRSCGAIVIWTGFVQGK
jgi:hypothetical protein